MNLSPSLSLLSLYDSIDVSQFLYSIATNSKQSSGLLSCTFSIIMEFLVMKWAWERPMWLFTPSTTRLCITFCSTSFNRVKHYYFTNPSKLSPFYQSLLSNNHSLFIPFNNNPQCTNSSISISLILAPSSIIYHWKHEIEHFLPSEASSVFVYFPPFSLLFLDWMDQ